MSGFRDQWFWGMDCSRVVGNNVIGGGLVSIMGDPPGDRLIAGFVSFEWLKARLIKINKIRKE